MTVDEFIEKMKQKASEGLLRVSGNGKLSRREWNFQNGTAEITTIRGGTIEKAAIMHLKLKRISESGVSEDINHEVYQMEVFPENPYCPMGHFNTELYVKEPHLFYLNLDLFPAVQVEEDLRSMKTAMDAVADQFGRDREKTREGLDKHYTMEHFPAPLAAMVGCKLPELKDEDFELFVAAYDTFLSTYLEILNKRKGNTYAESEIQVKLARNGKWLQYLTLKDKAFRGAGDSGIPSEMLIEMGFPPSAAF